MVGFAASAHFGIFCFDKITYFDAVLQDCAWPQAREWTNHAARPKNRPVNMGKGPDNRAFTDRRAAGDNNMRFKDHVTPKGDISA